MRESVSRNANATTSTEMISFYSAVLKINVANRREPFCGNAIEAVKILVLTYVKVHCNPK
jgi:hypothetical protein